MMTVAGPNRKPLDLRVAGAVMFASGILDETGGGLFRRIPLRVFQVAGKLPLETYALFPDQREVPIALLEVVAQLDRAAHLAVLGGLLALEAGRLERARAHFTRALVFWNSEAAARSGRDSPPARLIARQCLEMLADNGR